MNSLACSKHDSTDLDGYVSKEFLPAHFYNMLADMSGLLTLPNDVPRRANHSVPRHKPPGYDCAFGRCFAKISRKSCGMQPHGFVDDTIQVLGVLQGCEVGNGF